MDQERLRAAVAGPFEREFRFLRELPTIIDTQNIIFVHGGVPSAEHMEELESWRCMKNDDFLSQDTHLEKWCVVGHWPSHSTGRKSPAPTAYQPGEAPYQYRLAAVPSSGTASSIC